jgi:hypothetical protein
MLLRWLVHPLVGPHITSKTDYVAIPSCLVTVARSCFVSFTVSLHFVTINKQNTLYTSFGCLMVKCFETWWMTSPSPNQFRMARGIHGLPKVSPRHAQLFYALRVDQPQNGFPADTGVARPQGGQHAVVFYPLGYPTPYGPGPNIQSRVFVC